MNAPSHVMCEQVISWLMSHMNDWVMWRMNCSHLCCRGRAGRVRSWAFHVWMHHVTHMKESCHIYECVMSHSCAICGARVMSDHGHATYDYVTFHVWMCHVTHINESCHIWICHAPVLLGLCGSCPTMSHATYEYVTFHLWMGHVTHMNKSCHVWNRHVPALFEVRGSCPTISHAAYEYVTFHVCTGHVTHLYEAYHTRIRHVPVLLGVRGSCPIMSMSSLLCCMLLHRTCIPRACVQHDSFTRVIWLSHVKSCVLHVSI